VVCLVNESEDVREFGRRSRAQSVRKSWLSSPTTVGEAEAKHMVDHCSGSDMSEAGQRLRAARLEFARARGVALTGGPVPFGFANPERREMVTSMQEGDQLWEFTSPEHYWQHMAGRAGIALVRKGDIIDRIVTAMN
jgi:hypothetical protein